MSTPPGGRAKRSGFALHPRLAALARTLGCALVATTAATAAGAATTITPANDTAGVKPAVSSNWAGYAIRGAHGGARHFKRVTGTWVQPAVTCTPGERTDSAFWVGLGGRAANSRGLEQTGTEADCGDDGLAHYSAWYELLPGGTVTVNLAIAPGDTIRAIVAVARRRVTMTLRDLTSGQSVKEVRHASRLDTTSAEWIVEAPSECNGSSSRCTALPLSDFGSMTFRGASARLRSSSHGAIASRLFSARPIVLSELEGGASGRRRRGPRLRVTATPSTLGPAGSSFAVSWAQQQS
jgi:hypothetical protein